MNMWQSIIALTLCTQLTFAETNTIRVTAKDNHMVTITMPENPTTGFTWFLTGYDAAFLTPVDKQFAASTSTLAGAPGVATWHFKSLLTVPAITEITFSSERPWSISQDALKKTYTIIIDP